MHVVFLVTAGVVSIVGGVRPVPAERNHSRDLTGELDRDAELREPGHNRAVEVRDRLRI